MFSSSSLPNTPLATDSQSTRVSVVDAPVRNHKPSPVPPGARRSTAPHRHRQQRLHGCFQPNLDLTTTALWSLRLDFCRWIFLVGCVTK
ncbi:hypothetical protein Q5P01_020070 [Channa striata]|uniref:Uncharacterized protein n=1 Tax=Channa striata TaxID=64152 RepID=A0AA88LWV1_CHASR|nr:hypothetical protein Q5P01_020070 [Channa striata]